VYPRFEITRETLPAICLPFGPVGNFPASLVKEKLLVAPSHNRLIEIDTRRGPTRSDADRDLPKPFGDPFVRADLLRPAPTSCGKPRRARSSRDNATAQSCGGGNNGRI